MGSWLWCSMGLRPWAAGCGAQKGLSGMGLAKSVHIFPLVLGKILFSPCFSVVDVRPVCGGCISA